MLADPRSEVDTDALYCEIAADEDGRVDNQTEGILEGALRPDDHRLPGCGMASGDRPSR